MSDCPAGSVCVDVRDGSCQQSCTTNQDCREGYACRGEKRMDRTGEALVCGED
jgi:hypothetical protein